MYIDINQILEDELEDINKLYKAVTSLNYGDNSGDNSEKAGESPKVNRCDASLSKRTTKRGTVYDKREMHKGKRCSSKIGGPDSKEVIDIKQEKYNKEMLDVLQKDRKFISKVLRKFVPYDPDSIDKHLSEIYRDYTGLVNKAPGVLSSREWMSINNRRNRYPMPENCNVAADGMDTRSKSELIIYSIIKSHGLALKYDVEITLKNEIGESVIVSPDFMIMRRNGKPIIIEHLGKMDDPAYLENVIKKIHLYIMNGYRLNDTLFITADYAQGGIDAKTINELICKMIIPRV